MLIFLHNPDYYNTATLPYFWNITSGSPLTAAIRADGYLNRPALTSSSGHSWVGQIMLWPPVSAPKNQFAMGARFLFETLPAQPEMIMAALGENGSIQTSLALNSDGTLSIYAGDLATELGSTNFALSVDTFYRIGFKGIVSPFAGSAEVWSNFTVMKRVTGNTAAAGAALGNFGGAAWGLVEDCAVNHMYLVDAFGALNDLIPPLLVQPLAPAVVSDLNQWLGAIPGAIDDTAPDGDSSRIAAYEYGERYGFTVGPLTDTPRILAAQAVALVKNIDEPEAGHRLLMYENGVAYPSPSVYGFTKTGAWLWQIGTDDYTVIRRLDYAAPSDAGQPLTTAIINAAEWGGEVLQTDDGLKRASDLVGSP